MCKTGYVCRYIRPFRVNQVQQSSLNFNVVPCLSPISYVVNAHISAFTTGYAARLRFYPAHGPGLSHLRKAGGGGQITRKIRTIATSGKRLSVGRGKFYKKKCSYYFLIGPNLRSQGVKKGHVFSKSGYSHRKSPLSQ